MATTASLSIYFLSLSTLSTAQTVSDNRLVGILSFASNNYRDSVAAKDIYATVSRIMVQTKRFTVLELDKWRLTQEEIERQKDGAFISQEIIARGKSLGAQVLIVGFVKNAELYNDGGKTAARVDYELKYIDVETGKSIAAKDFSGNSANIANIGGKASQAVGKMLVPAILSPGKKAARNVKTVVAATSALSAVSEIDQNTVNGKIIEAIEESGAKVNAWVRNTFGFNLIFMKSLEESKKEGVEYVLIEGGDDIGMKEHYKLKMVLVTEMDSPRGKIRDEEPIAELEVAEVRAQTSKCKVVKGGKRINEESQKKNMRIVFD